MKSLSEEAADIIRRRIITGEYHRGKQLKENELAAELSMSRSPVRQAMDKLAREFMIVHIPDKGSFVRGYSSREMEDFCQLRKHVEIMAVEGAIRNATDKNLAILKNHINKAGSFHRVLINMSGSIVAARAEGAYEDYMYLAREAALTQKENHKEIYMEHMSIYKKISERDVRGARSEISRHIEESFYRQVEYWTRRRMK